MFAEIFFGVVKYTAMLLFGRESPAAGYFLTVQFDLSWLCNLIYIFHFEKILSKRVAAAVHAYLLGLFYHGENNFLRCSSQGWHGRCWGARAVLPLPGSLLNPPGCVVPQQCPAQIRALIAAKPGMGEQGCVPASHLRLPQLLPSSWSTVLLMLKNRFSPQIWSWCARLMENPSSCCCKTPFPRNEGKFIAPRSQQRGCIYNSFWFLQEILFGFGVLWGYWDLWEGCCMCGFTVKMGGEALCFEHWCSHLLKLSLNLMSPHLPHRLLLSAAAG